MSSEVSDNPELQTSRHMSREVGVLATKFGLSGCVFVSFTDERVGVNSSGATDPLQKAMEALGDRILLAVSSGALDSVLFQWQDITTAPRDGSQVLVCDTFGRRRIANRHEDGPWRSIPGYYGISPQPKWWMPLPGVPKL